METKPGLPAEWKQFVKLRSGAKAIWIETPTNPVMNLVDLRAIAELAQRHGAITICDNTFLSPYFQRPLDLGVDNLKLTSKGNHNAGNKNLAIPKPGECHAAS